MIKSLKTLRTGYTTGAVAAAASKAAVLILKGVFSNTVEIPFPDGQRVNFKVNNMAVKCSSGTTTAIASVIKNAGDDPDVTNGIEIVAEAKIKSSENNIIIKGGKGVGIVTKPGLPVQVGEHAINPVPKQMIKKAVNEALEKIFSNKKKGVEIIISVIDGENIAKKTINPRLGIIGGISILGTTGIVKPLSSEAWKATISATMNVARAAGCEEIVISSGRTSEKAHIKKYALPSESYVLMGDYLKYSLLEAKIHGFKRVHICAQWAKMLKIALSSPNTHVKYGILDITKVIEFLKYFISRQGAKNINLNCKFNTARQIYEFIINNFLEYNFLFKTVCIEAKRYAKEIVKDMDIIVHLVSYEGQIISDSEI